MLSYHISRTSLGTQPKQIASEHQEGCRLLVKGVGRVDKGVLFAFCGRGMR